MISTSRLRATEYLPKNIYSNVDIVAKMPADIVRMVSIKKAEGLRISRKPTDHLTDISKSIITGEKTEKQIDNILLTRYACYLIAQNGDARKVEILNLN